MSIRAEIPEDVIGEVERMVRRYKEDKIAAENMIYTSPPHDGMPRGTAPGDPTAHAAIRREAALRRTKAIETALLSIEPEYRQMVWDVITKGRLYNTFPAASGTITDRRYQFIKRVAYELGLI